MQQVGDGCGQESESRLGWAWENRNPKGKFCPHPRACFAPLALMFLGQSHSRDPQAWTSLSSPSYQGTYGRLSLPPLLPSHPQDSRDSHLG